MLVNWNKKTVFVEIQKCASQALIKCLTNYHGFEQHYVYPQEYLDYAYFSIIRNPNERWISGLNQYVFNTMNIFSENYLEKNGKPKNIKDNLKFNQYFNDNEKLLFLNIEKGLLENNFVFDGHTQPQWNAVGGTIKSGKKTILLKLDDCISEKMGVILKSKVNIPYDNATKFVGYKLKNFNICQNFHSKYCENNEEFVKFYKNDFQMFEISR
jgi:hypothetical protein